MYPWFIWYISDIYIVILGALISVTYSLLNKQQFGITKQYKITKKNLFLSLLLIATIGWNIIHSNIYGVIGQLFFLITILLLVNAKDELKADIFKFITNGMAILVGISLLFYILFIIGIPLPHTTLPVSDLGYGGPNYYAFTLTQDITQFYRFKSIFAEPGHLSMGLIPLLYVNRLNLKNKSVLVLFIAELFTLSLAGYITLITSICIFSFSHYNSHRYATILLMISIFFSVFLFARLNEDSVLNKAIVARLVYDETKGTIAGDNRSKIHTDISFDHFVKSSDFLFGLDYKKYLSATYGSAGYKVYMIKYGLIGTILVFLFYLSYALFHRKYEIFGLLLIIMMLLYQNGYPFWISIVLTYILGISILFNEQKINPTN